MIFRGTKLTEKVMLDYSAAEEVSEAIDVKGNLILYVLLALVVIAVVGAIIARFEQRQKYKKVS